MDVKVTEAQSIPLAQLRVSKWNVNRVPKRMLRKIKRSLTEFGIVENLVARPHPDEPGAYELLSGNHRLQLLAEAGLEEAPVVIVEVDDAQARLLAQALNRTRGRDDPEAYRELMAGLLEMMSAADIAKFLSEAPADIARAGARSAAAEFEPVYGVIVDCKDEHDQVELLSVMLAEGRECRALL